MSGVKKPIYLKCAPANLWLCGWYPSQSESAAGGHRVPVGWLACIYIYIDEW